MQFYNGGPVFEMPMSGLLVHTMWNATSASWVFFNREALGWVMMMVIMEVMMVIMEMMMTKMIEIPTRPKCPKGSKDKVKPARRASNLKSGPGAL